MFAAISKNHLIAQPSKENALARMEASSSTHRNLLHGTSLSLIYKKFAYHFLKSYVY